MSAPVTNNLSTVEVPVAASGSDSGSAPVTPASTEPYEAACDPSSPDPVSLSTSGATAGSSESVTTSVISDAMEEDTTSVDSSVDIHAAVKTLQSELRAVVLDLSLKRDQPESVVQPLRLRHDRLKQDLQMLKAFLEAEGECDSAIGRSDDSSVSGGFPPSSSGKPIVPVV